MIFLLTALVTIPATSPQVAFTARFYSSGGKSHQEVYTCRLDGSQRKQITKGGVDKWDVQWLGKDRLCWEEWSSKGRLNIVIYDLNRGQVVKTIRTTGMVANPLEGKRGCPVFSLGEGFEVQPDEKLAPATSLRKWFLREKSWQWTTSGGKSISAPKGYAPPKPFDDTPVPYVYEGRSMSVGGKGVGRCFIAGKDGQDYLLTASESASAGDFFWLYSVDLAAGKSKLLVGPVDRLDFQPGSRYWSATDAGRPLTKDGKRNLWTSQVYVGDFATGKKWTIAKGLVLGESVQIEPGI